MQKLTKIKIQRVYTADLAFLKFPKLISRKIQVTGKICNFHTVNQEAVPDVHWCDTQQWYNTDPPTRVAIRTHWPPICWNATS